MRNGLLLPAVFLALVATEARAQNVSTLTATSPVSTTTVGTPQAASKANAPPQLKIEHENGTSIRFGVLTQLQYEANGRFADEEVSQNVFMRRMMLLIAGNVLRDFEYFIDSDFADMLKASGDQSLKNGPGFSIKDVFMTYKVAGDALKIDGGLMLPPLSRISLQGAPFLYGLDFFSNAYTHSGLFGTTGTSYGRDLGLQVRGLAFDGLLEYRAGVFQGRRGAPRSGHVGSRNPFRVAARVQLNVFDPDNVFFLRGTYLGEKRILSFGASIDAQHAGAGTYLSAAGDMLFELAGVTAQVDYVYRDGGGFLPLAKQHALMAEAGYLIALLRLSPILRLERRWGRGTTVDETDLGAGLSLFVFGHTSNLKAFYVRGRRDDAPDYDQFSAQWQLFFF
jgi:hypothetical protein